MSRFCVRALPASPASILPAPAFRETFEEVYKSAALWLQMFPCDRVEVLELSVPWDGVGPVPAWDGGLVLPAPAPGLVVEEYAPLMELGMDAFGVVSRVR